MSNIHYSVMVAFETLTPEKREESLKTIKMRRLVVPKEES